MSAPPPHAVQTATCLIWRDEFLRATFLPGAVVAAADADENLAVCKRLTSGMPMRAVIDLRLIRSQSAEARARFAGSAASEVSTAVALIVDSPLSRVIGNFFLGFNKPKEPTRLFNSLEAAEAWLRDLGRAAHE